MNDQMLRHRLCGRFKLHYLALTFLVLLALYFLSTSYFKSKLLFPSSLKSTVVNAEKTKRTTSEKRVAELVLTPRERTRKTDGEPVLPRPVEETASKLGHLGKPAYLHNLTADEEKENQHLWNLYGINHFLSQKISLHRVLRDPRPPK